MKKRLLAALVCVALVLTLLPKTARVTENYTMDFSQPTAVNWNNNYAKNFSTDDDSGTGWRWDANDKKLTLTDLDFETDQASALILPGDTTLVLYSTNTVTSTYDDIGTTNAIEVSNGDLTIQGTYALTGEGGEAPQVTV